MPISSLIVQAQSGRVEAVTKRLKTFPELEVTPGEGDHLVVVSETENRRQDREVLAVNLIYVNFEDLKI